VIAARRAPLPEVLALDLKKVGEVGPARQTQLDLDRLPEVVPDPDGLPHPVADEPVTADGQTLRGDAVELGIGGEERRGVVVDLPRGEHNGPGPSDREHESVEVAGVLVIEARHRALDDVPQRVGQHERRPLQDLDRARGEVDLGSLLLDLLLGSGHVAAPISITVFT
jgi:hypothetical protein